jgi:limonene-1,2-epoxide hydrolase
MTNAANEAIVRAFLGGMGPTIDGFKKTFTEMLTEDVCWESVGGAPHVGRDVCVAHVDELHRAVGMEYCTIEMLNIASNDDVVLTERIDRMHRADGSVASGFVFRIMGTFVIRDGKIARYTDYYDSLGAARAMGRI